MLVPSLTCGCRPWNGVAVGKVKIPYYVVVKGRGYWRTTPRMKAAGFSIVRCGPDGPAAWAIAAEWNERWQAVRRGTGPAASEPSSISRDQAEVVLRYPPRSVGAAFQAYIRTPEWSARAESARNKVWAPAWYRIREMWGDVDPNTIEFGAMSRWRAALEKNHGRNVAHKTLRVWRSLWTIMQGMKIALGADPSSGVRDRAPAPRHQRWTEGEVVRLVKAAWRNGYRGLACIVAIAWDTQFSPVDVRTLQERHRTVARGRLIFDRQVDGRAKTGRAALGTVSRRTERLVSIYLAGADRFPDVVLFRMRGGSPYREPTLSHDFKAVPEIVFPGDERKLMDMRRSGTVEAVAGGADAVGIASKMANSIGRSNTLHKTYSPVSLDAVLNTDAARLAGRRKMRDQNGKGSKV
jgi:hypothetical protein